MQKGSRDGVDSAEQVQKRCGYAEGYVRFEVFTAVTMNKDVFWDVLPCGACKDRRFGGTHRLLHQGDKNQ
jgi:hypothetical protein